MLKGRKELWQVDVETAAGSLKVVVTSENLAELIRSKSFISSKDVLILKYILNAGFKLSKMRSMTIKPIDLE